MSLTDTTTLKFMCGLPAMYKDICLVSSPSLKEIAAEGLERFYQYISIIQIKKPSSETDEITKLLSPLSDFEYLLLLT
jgi:hypothetical protein